MTLPSPGPGRPQHPSYSEPMRGATAFEVELVLLVVAVIAFFYLLGEVLS